MDGGVGRERGRGGKKKSIYIKKIKTNMEKHKKTKGIY